MLSQLRRTKVYSRLGRHEIVRQFVKYAMVGCVNVALFLGIFNLLLHLGAHDLVADVIAFALTSISSFTFNKLWSFRDTRTHAVVRQYFLFVSFTLIGLGLQLSLFSVLLVPLRDFGRIGKNAAALGALPFSVIWNFTAYRRWTFKATPRATSV